MIVSRPISRAIARSCAIFSSDPGMNDCPPNPGSTLITSTRSTSGNTSRSASTGVAGLTDTPALAPARRISATHPAGSSVASRWKVTRSAPASAKRATYFSGLTIIRCTSRNFAVALRMAFSTGNPNEMLGTKTPSITSIWTHSAALASTIRVSRSRWPKSAESIEGATIRCMNQRVCRSKIRKIPRKILPLSV